MRRLLFLIPLLASCLGHAEDYIGPEVEPPYYQVRYEASKAEDGLKFAVQYTVWIPEVVENLRGVIVHQHGCGTGSAKSGLTGAFDLHWQALAREHDCALLSPVYEYEEGKSCRLWCDPEQGSAQAFQEGLRDLGKLSGHPELEKVPWALWGHSGGGVWVGIMTALYPERVAATWMRSGVLPIEQRPNREPVTLHEVNELMLSVPMMVNLGTGEGVTVKEGRFSGVWPAAKKFMENVREKNGLGAISIDPLTDHQCGNQRYLAMPWFDVCLEARLPKSVGAPLRVMDRDAGVLVPFHKGKAISVSEFEGDATQMGWLPTPGLGEAWETYVEDTSIADATPPPAPFDLQFADGKLSWKAHADLESGLAGFVIKRAGKVIAELPEENRNPFGRPLFQGLQYSDTPKPPLEKMEFIDPNPAKSVEGYEVISKNTLGLLSSK
ncbi:MAG: hypothetical protein P1U85_14135 [Verrucomicrobiales bacterium]|nr:hypothetical protein [Verrucomicrobiales bacterium]